MENNMEVSEKRKNFFTRAATGITEFYEEYKTERPVTSKLVMLAIAGVLLAIILLFVHNQTIHSQAICFDDYQYVFDNSLVKNPSFISVKHFFTEILNPSTVEGYYQPLAMVSLMADCALGGGKDNIGVFHITSLLIHILNSFLVLLLFYLLFKKIRLAFIGGFLFGIHPVAIEEIAWLSERKSILATLFLLLSLILYILYVKSSKKRYIIISLAVFILALLSKPIAVSLPFIIILFDYFWFKRLSFLKILEKVPYIIIALIFSVIAYKSQANTFVLVDTTQNSSILEIFLLICYNNIFYLWKLLLPTQLSPFYTYVEPLSFTNPAYLISAALTILIIIFFIITRRWSKPLLLGYLFYIISILPTSGIIRVTSSMACFKYAYFPSIGIFLCLIILLNNISKLKNKQVLKYVIVPILVFSISFGEIAASSIYSAKWQNTNTLDAQMLAVNPNSVIVLNALATTCISQGKYDNAIEYLNKSLTINPINSLTYVHLGTALSCKKQDAEAISMFNKSLELGLLDSSRALVLFNLGKIYVSNKYFEEAKKCFEESISLNPQDLSASFQLAITINYMGNFDEAVSICKNILKDHPNSASAYTFLGILYADKKDYTEAITQLSIALAINPYDSFSYYTLGNILVNYNKFEEAGMCYNEALKLDPTNTNIINQYAKFYAQQSKFDNAITLLNMSINILKNSEAYIILGDIYKDIDKYKESVDSYQKALELNPNLEYIQESINSLKEKMK